MGGRRRAPGLCSCVVCKRVCNSQLPEELRLDGSWRKTIPPLYIRFARIDRCVVKHNPRVWIHGRNAAFEARDSDIINIPTYAS
jgi:hypothetical protein